MNEHVKAIESALDSKDVSQLRLLARKGLVNTNMRSRAWPVLLGVSLDAKDLKESSGQSGKNGKNGKKETYGIEYESSETFKQVKKDTERSMYHFDITKKYDKKTREEEQIILERMLHGIFCENRDLHYTQGFHDICSVFYIVCGEQLGRELSENVAKQHLRDIVRDNITVFKYISQLLFPLVSLIDEELFNFLCKSEVTPLFSISWLLTWFAHNIENFDDICRLYDLFLASHPLMPMYFSVACIKSVKKDLFKVECEFTKVYKFFSQFNWNIDFDMVIQDCVNIFDKYPPRILYREFCMDDLTKQSEELHLSNLPKDSPFLALSVEELENMKKYYSGQRLLALWNPENPKFWKVIALPVLTAFVVGYCVTTWKAK